MRIMPCTCGSTNCNYIRIVDGDRAIEWFMSNEGDFDTNSPNAKYTLIDERILYELRRMIKRGEV